MSQLTQHPMVKIVRRHTHDVRNHCSSIDLDANLLAELSDDPEITAMALRLKKQVARIELDLKLLLLKLEEPQLVTLTLGDLLQLWRMKLKPFSINSGSMIWPESHGETSLTLDSKRTIQAMCGLTLHVWDRHPGASLAVGLRREPDRVMLDLMPPPNGLPPADDFLEEMQVMLVGAGLKLFSDLDTEGQRWVITLVIPLTGSA